MRGAGRGAPAPFREHLGVLGDREPRPGHRRGGVGPAAGDPHRCDAAAAP